MLKNVSVTASTIEANSIGEILRNGRSMPGYIRQLKECQVLLNISVLGVIDDWNLPLSLLMFIVE